MDPGARVWAEVDLEAVRHNVGLLKAMVGPGVEVLTVAKADAYGHGAVGVVRAALSAGASRIGVGDSSEALELIDAGLRAPILVLGAILPGEADRVVAHGIHVALHGLEGARRLAAVAARQGRPARVHVLVDTGMGRLGVLPGSAERLLAEVRSSRHLELVGLATHFSTPEDPDFTARQVAAFDAVRARVGEPVLVHAAASAALVRYPATRHRAVRPGLLTYGLDPGGLDPVALGFRPALSLRARVVHVKDVGAGVDLGYSRTYRTAAPTRIATLAVGYHDGYPIGLSNVGSVLLGRSRCPIVGRVSMDYTLVDVGAAGAVAEGDIATLVGSDGTSEIRVEQVAAWLGTIPYAVVCGLGTRVRRHYTPDPSTLPVSSTSLEASRAPAPRQ